MGIRCNSKQQELMMYFMLAKMNFKKKERAVKSQTF